jgi:hypothetical protein
MVDGGAFLPVACLDMLSVAIAVPTWDFPFRWFCLFFGGEVEGRGLVYISWRPDTRACKVRLQRCICD